MAAFSMVLTHPLSRNPNDPALPRSVEVNDEELMKLIEIRLSESDVRFVAASLKMALKLQSKGLVVCDVLMGTIDLTDLGRALLYFNADAIADKLAVKLTAFI